MVSEAQRIILADHARLPWRFFGRLTAVQAAFDRLPPATAGACTPHSIPIEQGIRVMKPRTLYDKIWDDHLVDEQPDGTCLIYIDRHLVHEVTCPQAFEGLRAAGRKVHAPEKTLAVVDHNVPTSDRNKPNPDPESAEQIAVMAQNAKDFGIEYFDESDKRQGIVHIIGPEQGFTLPGTTIVCGDSHTATHGAFGALAYGIGTSEVEHVLATQTLIQTKSKNMRAVVDGKLPAGVTAKDIILAIIGEIGTAGGTGFALEYAGEAIRALLDGRAHDHLQHVGGRRRQGRLHRAGREGLRLSQGQAEGAQGRGLGPGHALLGNAALRRRRAFRPRDQARRRQTAAAGDLGHQPRAGDLDHRQVPVPTDIADEKKRIAAERSLGYMGLQGGEKITDIKLDRVFIGSCTNARIEDLREVARVVTGKTVNANVSAMIVPGSGLVKEQAEAEGLDKIFKAAGFDWREPGCSMCLAMNPDKLAAGRALRLDLQPQLRRPPGLQGPHASGVAGDGGGGGDRRAFRRRAGVEVIKRVIPAARQRATGMTLLHTISNARRGSDDTGCLYAPSRSPTLAQRKASRRSRTVRQNPARWPAPRQIHPIHGNSFSGRTGMESPQGGIRQNASRR